MSRHAANLKTSLRLQKVLAVLQDGEWHTSFDLMQKTNLVAIGSAISELRAPINGLKIECDFISKGRFRYRLITQSCPPQDPFLTPFFRLETELIPGKHRLQPHPIQEGLF